MYHRCIERDPDSHKGQNGSIAVIGGSKTMHGAPLFSALAAERSGVDLAYVALPACHCEVAKATSLNFQVHPFHGDTIGEEDLEPLLELLAVMDCAVIGPGLGLHEETLHVIRELVDGAACPLVLDASALQPFLMRKSSTTELVLTPHLGELERMGITEEELPDIARRLQATIFLKGKVDVITLPDGSQRTIGGGNPGLTVGGTGDALAGLICGLIAQGMPNEDACMAAGAIIKRAGEELLHTHGFAYGTRTVIDRIPHLLKAYAA